MNKIPSFQFALLPALALLMCGLQAHAQFALIPVLGANFGISHTKAFSDITINSKGVKTGMLAQYALSNTFAVNLVRCTPGTVFPDLIASTALMRSKFHCYFKSGTMTLMKRIHSVSVLALTWAYS